MQAILTYIYTGAVEVGTPANGDELFRMATKLQLPDLVKHLGKRMASGITVENFTQTALLADSNTCQMLMQVRTLGVSARLLLLMCQSTGLHPLPPRQPRCDHRNGPVGRAQEDEVGTGRRAIGGEGAC